MAGEKRKVAVVADFFRKMTDKDVNAELFLKIMEELDIEPVMHEYVYDYELAGNAVAKMLERNGQLRVYRYDEFICDANRTDYKDNFLRAYYYFNACKFKGDIFLYHHEKESLGEIRTSLMALYMGIDLFMSDDGAAKEFVMNRLSSGRHKITVYNIYDTLVELHNREASQVKWADIKGMAKYAFEKAANKYDRINKIWHDKRSEEK